MMNLEHAKIASHNPETEAITDICSKQHTNSNLLTGAINYWLPESLGFTHAMACVEIVLLRSDKANAIYREIVQAWRRPGCQAILEAILPYMLNRIIESQSKIESEPQYQAKSEAKLQTEYSHTPDASRYGMQATKSNVQDKIATENTINKPEAKAVKRLEIKKPEEKKADSELDLWFQSEKFRQLSEDVDCQYSMNRIKKLILVGFNRKIDRDNKRWKVIPETPSHLLIRAISWRSIAEYYEIRRQDLIQFKGQVNDKIYDFDYKMPRNPTTRKERSIKKVLVQAFKHDGFVLRHDEKQLNHADQWYKCRVNPGSITDYLNELADQDPPIIIERARVSLDLAPYDEATGYPRQWRK